jgi:cyclic beta-1,2-glucan synthetase
VHAIGNDRRVTPAAESLLDNFYLIEEQIRTARRHLPKSSSRELPRLANGPNSGYPRVYELALELIAHADGRIDERSLTSFIAAYQTIQPLNLGELCAIPIMVRLVR